MSTVYTTSCGVCGKKFPHEKEKSADALKVDHEAYAHPDYELTPNGWIKKFDPKTADKGVNKDGS